MQTLSTTLAAAIAAGTPQRVLLEFTDYTPVKQFSNEDIFVSDGLQLSAEFNSEKDLTVGKCPSAQIQFTMRNDADQLANFNFGTFKAYIGARIDTGTPASDAKTKTFTENGQTVTYEFSPLGTFIAKRPDIIVKKMIEVDANDQMTLFDKDMPANVTAYPTTIGGLASALCAHVGVTLKSSTFLNSTLTVSAEPEKFDGATMREVIGWIAEAACSIARFDRDGKLEFAWFSTVSKTYDEHDYMEFTPTWYETDAIDGLHIRNGDSTEEFTVGTGANAYMIQDNPFLRQADNVVENTLPVITSQPSNASVTVGETATFSVTATGATGYQWYYLTPTALSWTAVQNNGTSATYTLTTAARHNNYKYHCKVSNSEGYVMTNTVTLTLTEAEEETT